MLKKTSIKHINSEQSPKTNGDINLPRSADFFAGSGLVSEAMRGIFSTVWANDICEKKQRLCGKSLFRYFSLRFG